MSTKIKERTEENFSSDLDKDRTTRMLKVGDTYVKKLRETDTTQAAIKAYEKNEEEREKRKEIIMMDKQTAEDSVKKRALSEEYEQALRIAEQFEPEELTKQNKARALGRAESKNKVINKSKDEEG